MKKEIYSIHVIGNNALYIAPAASALQLKINADCSADWIIARNVKLKKFLSQ